MTNRARVVLGTTSAISMAIAVGLLTATVVLGVLAVSEDSDGFVDSPHVSLASDGYAITTEDIDFGSIPEQWLPPRFLGTFRVEAVSITDQAIFIGIGPADEVDAYLDSVARSEIRHIGRNRRVTYDVHPGTSTPEPAASQDFWTATTGGAGMQTLDWEPTGGNWTMVIMNADMSFGIDLTASTGVSSAWIGVAPFVVGGLALAALALAVVLAVFALRSPPPSRAVVAEPPQMTGVAT